MIARAVVPLALVLCLCACASSSGGGRGGGISVGHDGILTRGGASRSDMGFVYADKGCLPYAIDNDKTALDFLGNPGKVVRTNDYIGTVIYAVPVGAHTLTVRSMVTVDGMGKEAFPVTPLTVQARHFYGIDCTHNGSTVDVSVTDHDHVGSNGDD